MSPACPSVGLSVMPAHPGQSIDEGGRPGVLAQGYVVLCPENNIDGSL